MKRLSGFGPIALSLAVLFSVSADSSFLSDLEREVLSEMNLARKAPDSYAAHLEKTLKYYSGRNYRPPEASITMRTNEGKKAVQEAVAFLKKASPLPEFRISKGMSMGARDHVKDTAKRGIVGHSGSDGSSPFDRISRYGKWQRTAGENISYGQKNGRDVVFQLIVDDGVPSRGHRENIFNPDFLVTGIACGKHAAYESQCVITYAHGYSEK